MFANLEGKTIAIGALLVGIAAALAFHFIEVAGLHRQIDKLALANTKLAQLNDAYKSANETCAELSRQQSAQVQALQDAALAREQAASAAVAAAQAQAVKKYADAQAVLKRAPSHKDDSCASLNDLLDEALRSGK